jgi:hypothetical protein
MEAYSCNAQFLVSNSVSIQIFVVTSASLISHVVTLLVLPHCRTRQSFELFSYLTEYKLLIQISKLKSLLSLCIINNYIILKNVVGVLSLEPDDARQ